MPKPIRFQRSHKPQQRPLPFPHHFGSAEAAYHPKSPWVALNNAQKWEQDGSSFAATSP